MYFSRDFKDLSMSDLSELWYHFLWGLQGSKAWEMSLKAMNYDEKSTQHKLIDDLTRQGIFLKFSPRKIQTVKDSRSLDESQNFEDEYKNISPEIYKPTSDKDAWLQTFYEMQLKKFKKDPKAWKDEYFFPEYEYSSQILLATCSNEHLTIFIKYLFAIHPKDVDRSLMKALKALEIDDALLIDSFFKIKLLSEKECEDNGFKWENLFFNRSYLKNNRKPDEIYRWRGLKMSYSHIELAKALFVRGFMFASEASVFPLNRKDKSFITPDLMVLYKGNCLIVEVDGPSHEKPKQRQIDRERDEMFLKEGFHTKRFKANTALTNPHACISEIVNFFEKR